MSLSRSSRAVLVAVALVFTASAWAGAASMTDAQLVATRQAKMKEDGAILKGAKTLTGADAVAAATKILANFTAFPGLFRPSSITPDSRATTKIWENWADFTARLAEEKANAQAMLAAAKSGDKACYLAAVDALKQPCSNCHLAYARIL